MINSKDVFQNFSDESKVWVYQSDKALSENEIQQINTELNEFTNNWDSHGSMLVAGAFIPNPYFVVIAVDQTKVGLCGGSVDAKTRFMKSLGKEIGVDFFNRMIVTIKESETLKQIPFSEINEHKDAYVFDPLITTLGELKEKWLLPIKESKFAHLVK